MNKWEFENKIKAYIEKSGRSQAAVARLLGESPDTFNKWVRGVNTMSLQVLDQLCSLLNLTETQRAELFRLLEYPVLSTEAGLTFDRFLQGFQLKAEFTPHQQLKLPIQADQLVKDMDFVGLKWSSLFGFTVALVQADGLSEDDIKRISQNFFAFNDFLYLKNPKGLKVSRLAWWLAFTLAGVICFVFEQGCTTAQLDFIRGQRKTSPAYDQGATEWWWWQNNATSFTWVLDLGQQQLYQHRGKLPDGSNYHARKTVSEVELLVQRLGEIMQGG